MNRKLSFSVPHAKLLKGEEMEVVISNIIFWELHRYAHEFYPWLQLPWIEAKQLLWKKQKFGPPFWHTDNKNTLPGYQEFYIAAGQDDKSLSSLLVWDI